MRVVVAGSEGSLMQSVIPYLIDVGHEVVGVDSLFRYGETQRHRNYEFIKGDLCDERIVDEACDKADAIIQGAARIFGVRGFHQYAADILARDLELQQNLLWAAIKGKVDRFVYISSSMVYERCSQVPSSEEDVEDMPIPSTDYGLSKLVGERLCRSFGQQYGLNYTIWRPFNIITPHERADPSPGISHVFADFIEKLIVQKQNPLEILGDGEQIRCFTWIEDVARAIVDFSFAEETIGQAFNLGNPEPTNMKQLAQSIFAIGQSRGLIDQSQQLSYRHLPIYADDVRVRIPSIDKAQKLLGWSPTVSFDDALERCIDAAVA